MSKEPKEETAGGPTSYYDVKDCKDVDEICEYLGMSFAEGNALKALFGIAIARKSGSTRHTGTNAKRDAAKLKHYANRIFNLNNKNSSS